MATDGIGSVQHISGELFMTMTSVNLTPVHYRGDPPALNDLIGGQVQVIFDTLPPSLGFIKAGKLRALGVTTATRLDVLPDVAPIGDFVPGYLAGGWLGVGAPKGTPAEIVDRLNSTINAALADPALRTRLVPTSATPYSPARPPTSASSSLTKLRSGAKSSVRPISKRSDPGRPSDIPYLPIGECRLRETTIKRCE